MTDADLQHWRERLAKVSGPTCTFDDLNEWRHDSREIAKRMIAEIDAKQTGWQTASARVVDLEGQLHAMAEQVAVMEGPARNYNRTLARAEQAEARLADERVFTETAEAAVSELTKKLAEVSGPSCGMRDLQEWLHDSREIAKRLIAEIERLQRENERLKALVHGRVRP